MKKVILLLMTIALISCSPTQRTIIAAKKTLKGDWSLNEITYSESGIFDVTLYNDATAECMAGSTWRFIPNNHTGYYTINRCESTGNRNFRFTIPEPDQNGNYSFLFKPIDTKKKSTNGNKGYRMGLDHLDDQVMTWKMTTILEGKPFVITMNFSKI
ncbi:lipocalin family protein [Aquimarina rhabdastrellae]